MSLRIVIIGDGLLYSALLPPAAVVVAALIESVGGRESLVCADRRGLHGFTLSFIHPALMKTFIVCPHAEPGSFRRALLSGTTAGPEAVYQKGGWNGDIHAISRPIQRGILRFAGWDVAASDIAYAPLRGARAIGLLTVDASR